jgi:succinyl-diaminopimelate desuccinylase
VPEESPEEIIAVIQACFEGSEVLVMHTGSVLETAADDEHVQRLAALAARLSGMQPAFHDEHFGSDARFYSQAGIPAVCFGPAGAGLHSHEEWVDIASLEQFYRVMRELAQSY